MDFATEVNKKRDDILHQRQYSVAIKSIMDRANTYMAEQRVDENLKAKTEGELEK